MVPSSATAGDESIFLLNLKLHLECPTIIVGVGVLVGVIVGVCIAIAPVIIAFWMGKRKPEAFAAKKFVDSGFQRWLLGIATVYLSIIILILGIGLFVANIFLGWAIGFEGAHLIIMFGSLLVSAPLFVEGLWVLSAYKRGIEHVCVLRKGKWSHE